MCEYITHQGGFEKEDTVFIDIAFSDLENLPEINNLFISLFPENERLARTVYEVQKFPFGGKIKIVGTAVKDVKHLLLMMI